MATVVVTLSDIINLMATARAAVQEPSEGTKTSCNNTEKPSRMPGKTKR